MISHLIQAVTILSTILQRKKENQHSLMGRPPTLYTWLFKRQLHIPAFNLSFISDSQQRFWYDEKTSKDYDPLLVTGKAQPLRWSLQALTNFLYIHVSTLLWSSLFRVWDYDDRFLCRDFPFSCLSHSVIIYVVLSRCCIYFGVKNRIFYGSLKKKF